MSNRRFLLYWLLAIILFPSLSGQAYGSGACCAVTKGRSGKINLSVVGSSAWSHEMIADNTYNLTQQAVMLKLGYPFGPGFLLQGQVGMPAATKLSHKALDMRGNGGFIYGVGLGYELPQFLKPMEFFASVSYTRSQSSLERMEGVGADAIIDQTFFISEVQGLFLGEIDLLSRTALYGGLRLYSGKNQLKDNQTNTKESGEREGNLSPLLGIRQVIMGNVSLVADVGLGHTKVVGVGAVLSL